MKDSHTSRLVSLLFAIGRRMRDGSHGKTKKSGSLLHFETLRYVQERGSPLMREVADHLCVTPPAATALIDGLVKHGFIARTLDAKDRRAVKLGMTRKGTALLDKELRKKMREMEKVFSVLSAKEEKELIAILTKVITTEK